MTSPQHEGGALMDSNNRERLRNYLMSIASQAAEAQVVLRNNDVEEMFDLLSDVEDDLGQTLRLLNQLAKEEEK